MTFQLRCFPRFDYARSSDVVQSIEGGVLFTPASDTCPPMLLRGSVQLIIEGEAASAEFTLSRGEKASFIFGLPKGLQSGEDTGEVVQRELEATGAYWRAWAAKSLYRGRWREMVTRSALALKLLTSDRYGSLIAAPTFGLPEFIGGSRNWDYRYTWLRDASFTLYALSRLGYVEEGERFNGWLKSRLRWDCGHGPLQVMYGLDGRTELPEITLDHLAGYQQSGKDARGIEIWKTEEIDGSRCGHQSRRTHVPDEPVILNRS